MRRRGGLAQLLEAKLPFDEAQLLLDNKEYLLRALNLEELEVHPAKGDAAEKALPAAPVVRLA